MDSIGPRDGETDGFGDGVRASACLGSDMGVGVENELAGPHRWCSGKVGAEARVAGWEVQRLLPPSEAWYPHIRADVWATWGLLGLSFPAPRRTDVPTGTMTPQWTQNCHGRPHGYECSCKAGYTMDK